MSEKGRSIFNDRRTGIDRRGQSLPMPAGLDRRGRRGNCRRSRHFLAQPWWLRIDYAEELISEQKNLEHLERLELELEQSDETTPSPTQPDEGLPNN